MAKTIVPPMRSGTKSSGVSLQELMIKKKWYRRTLIDSSGQMSIPLYSRQRKMPIMRDNGDVFVEMTQSDFLNEIDTNTHKVNSQCYRSPRAVYKQVTKNGKAVLVVDHYEDVERVAVGLQEYIVRAKTSHFAANGIWIANESGRAKDEQFSKLQSWYDTAGLDVAFYDVVKSTFRSGDGAVYVYREDRDIKFKVFSYLKGDTLYPSIDENGNEMLTRKFVYQDKDAVEIYRVDRVEFWVKDDYNIASSDDKSWWDRWISWLVKGNTPTEFSEDGYKLVYRKRNQCSQLQVAYFRVDDIPSSPAQQTIDSLEKALSDLSEENRYYAFQMIFLKGNIKSLPGADTRGKVYRAKGENDDMKAIQPASSSNTVSIAIKEYKENISFSTGTVFITPDILKGGDFSSAALKQLYAPQIQWCQDIQPEFFNGIKKLISIFKELVGLEEGDIEGFLTMRVSVGQDFWIPQNEKEMVDMTSQKVFAGIMSRKAAIEEVGNKHAEEYDQILKEMEEKQRMSAKNKEPEEKNPIAPDIDNNAPQKKIIEDTGV